MWAPISSVFTVALGLATVVASAPQSLSSPGDCLAASTTTVFVTVSASSPEPSTVYVTAPVSSIEVNLSEAPASTLTRFATLYSTTTAPPTSNEYLSASSGLFSYVVENGTTYWLGGQTPASGGPYAYSTRSITVVPVYDPTSSSEQATGTLTVQSTLYVTKQFTLTEILDSTSISSNTRGALTSAGTGLPYSKAQGGWNATKTSSGRIYSGATNAVSASKDGGVFATGSPTLVLYSTFNIYETSHSTISKSTLVAASGFYAFSTPFSSYTNSSTTLSDLGSLTSSASGQKTTASINTVTVSTGGSYGSPGLYANSTSTTSIRGKSVASGILTSLSSRPSRSLLPTPSSSSESQTSTETCTETPYIYGPTPAPINSTFATSVRATSAVSGVLTSLHSSASGYTVGSSSTFVNSTTSGPSATGGLPTSLYSSGLYSSSSSAASTISYIASTPVVQNSSSLASTSTPSIKTSTYVSSSASASPSSCGESGDFVLNFDDIPPLSIGNQDPDTVQPEPVFNPYHQFDFSDGFTVVPPPTDPYLPSSPPLLLEFIPNFNVNGTNPQAGPNTAEEGYSGQISDGDFDQTGCFRFNVYGAKFGCDSTGAPCDFTFTGYQLDASQIEVQVAAQTVSIAACPALAHCDLLPINLDATFENLAFVRINVTVADEPKIWWMDDLRLGWYNNTCATGLCRQTAHIH